MVLFNRCKNESNWRVAQIKIESVFVLRTLTHRIRRLSMFDITMPVKYADINSGNTFTFPDHYKPTKMEWYKIW